MVNTGCSGNSSTVQEFFGDSDESKVCGAKVTVEARVNREKREERGGRRGERAGRGENWRGDREVRKTLMRSSMTFPNILKSRDVHQKAPSTMYSI
jgi:hypothetical protein